MAPTAEWQAWDRPRSRERRRRSRSRSSGRDRRRSGSRDRYRSRRHSRSRSPRSDRHRRRSRSRDRSGSGHRPDYHDDWRGHHPGEDAGGWSHAPHDPQLPRPWHTAIPGLESLGDDYRHPQGHSGRFQDAAGPAWEPAAHGSGEDDPGMYRRHHTPSASVHVKGIPEEAVEADLYMTFEEYPNIVGIKLLRDRMTQRGRGMAYVDFATVADAERLMESAARRTLSMGNGMYPLQLDYSHSRRAGGPRGPGDEQSGALDWVCDMCNAVNFARRCECYHCSCVRPANPKRVDNDTFCEPSHVVKVSGIDPTVSEEALLAFLSSIVPGIRDLRVIKDKYTGAPRNYAFVELHSIPDAGRLVLAVNGAVPEGTSQPLRASYARPRDSDAVQQQQQQPAGLAAAAAAEQASGVSAGGWKPKEFDAAAAFGGATDGQQAGTEHGLTDPQQTQQQAQQQHHSATEAATTGVAAGAEQDGRQQPQQQQVAGPQQGGSGGELVGQAEALEAAGFTFDLASGYWYEPRTGYYYDANTRLYYHPSTQLWYQLDAATGQYSAVGGTSSSAGAEQQQPQQQQQQQQQPAPQQQQQQLAAGPTQRPAPDRRRTAVIGASAKYNPEALKAAAAAAKEKEEEQRRQAAAQAAWQLQQQQQQGGHKKGPGQRQQPLPAGRPGIGAGASGAGSGEGPAVVAVVSNGGVQGVIHRSKWAQRSQQ